VAAAPPAMSTERVKSREEKGHESREGALAVFQDMPLHYIP